MPSWRCSMCAINWPVAHEYKHCPECGEMTYSHSEKSITFDEARARVKIIAEHEQRLKEHKATYDAFEEFYAEREAARFRKELEAAKY